MNRVPLEASVGQDVCKHPIFQGDFHLAGDLPVESRRLQKETRCGNGQQNHGRALFPGEDDHGAQVPRRFAGVHPPQEVVAAVAENHHIRPCLGEDGGEPPESLRGHLARHAGSDNPDLQEPFQDLRVALSGTRPVAGGQAVAEGQDGFPGIEPRQPLPVGAAGKEGQE